MGGNQKAGFYMYNSRINNNRVIIKVKLQTVELFKEKDNDLAITKNKYSRRAHIRPTWKFENVVVTNKGRLRELAFVSEHTLKRTLTVKIYPGLVSGQGCCLTGAQAPEAIYLRATKISNREPERAPKTYVSPANFQ